MPDYSSNVKAAIVVDINTQMRSGRTLGVSVLNPLDISASIMLSMYYKSGKPTNVDMFAYTDKINLLNLYDKPDFTTMEAIFQGVKSSKIKFKFIKLN